jgi:hypothetical protein
MDRLSAKSRHVRLLNYSPSLRTTTSSKTFQNYSKTIWNRNSIKLRLRASMCWFCHGLEEVKLHSAEAPERQVAQFHGSAAEPKINTILPMKPYQTTIVKTGKGKSGVKLPGTASMFGSCHPLILRGPKWRWSSWSWQRWESIDSHSQSYG